jgi:hypothetical protein
MNREDRKLLPNIGKVDTVLLSEQKLEKGCRREEEYLFDVMQALLFW